MDDGRNSRITTSFLLANLHCPSCVSSIQQALQESSSHDVIWVSPNVVTSVVTIEHRDTPTPDITIRCMAKSLQDAGFEICGVTTTAATDTDLDTITQSQPQAAAYDIPHNSALDGLLSFAPRWSSESPEAQREAHLLNCKQCRESEDSSHSEGQVVPSNSNGHQSRLQNSSKSNGREGVKAMAPDGSKWRATLSVGGMTCASCVNAIREELNKRDWIENATVNLVTNSATVDFTDKSNALKIAEAIEDMGYDASLDSLAENGNNGDEDSGDDTERKKWRMTVAIGGMTCASCANTITEQLNKKAWISNVAVNLVANSATIDYTVEGKQDDIVQTIDDMGYDATLDTVTRVKSEEKGAQQRTVQISIKGLYCQHCPSRVTHSLTSFTDRLKVVSQPTHEKPLVTVKYTPSAPLFTIRQILSAIDAADPSFKASIYHPPSLEERSKIITQKHQQQLLRRVYLTFVMTIPTFIIGIVYMSLIPDTDHGKHYLMEPWTSGLNRAQIALFILSTPVYFFGADVFHVRAVKEIRNLWRPGSRTPILRRFYKFGSMNMLMSLGTTIAYVSSISQMISAAISKPAEVDDTHFYFDSVVFLTLFLLLGRLIESYSKSKTGDAVEMLGKLRPTTAILVNKDSTGKTTDSVVGVDMLEYGDIVRVPHGASPAADGIVVQGESSFDESSLTGESRLIKKMPGDEVHAGTVNKNSAIQVRITGAAGASMLDRIVSIVREGQTKRAPMERVADVLTAYFVPIITLIAVVTWLTWMILGYTGAIPGRYLDSESGWMAFALQFAIAVFVVACPCGLALAAPTAIFVGGGLAAKHGILAKGGGEAFEKASNVDVVVFDKTGTLTVGGEPKVTDSKLFLNKEDAVNLESSMVLATLRAIEENSSHPVAKAIVSYCITQTETWADVDGLQELPGKGMKATNRGEKPDESFDMIVGNESLMRDHAVDFAEEVSFQLQKWKSEAKSVALVAVRPTTAKPDVAWTLVAVLSISDPIRPEAIRIIKALHDQGTRVWMLSGDNVVTAKAVAKLVGIDPENVLAEVLPWEKADKITYLQTVLKARVGRSREHAKKRAMVAMVGDGINDSPALTKADVGIAIGSGSDVAISSADFVLVTNDLRAVVTLLALSRTVFRRIKVNFGWAVIYNILAIPIAAGCLYPITTNGGQHVRLDPVWASLAMALSSISVVLSSLALRSKIPWLGFRARKIE
ncbi:heavy metal translocating P-type ATPase [Colletotrichum higginsianum]|uniref:Heavy metal translocating P-type ATPase n=2 Tax=Colletotrichum higginsianum TaxID=80884 RepID=H1V536_COLHI|nr:Heavy metal translocating P-type ATPase [Colletotrichum higginsianum IMI 349063]OBR09351.1 Heavy metal translocating P-type ATPase [Colletotrichum higginsianum IMI 349063]TIC96148.1 putative copper-transporting ATPase HMA5 [Colletotrichum higginsianum]CCF35338.1 heavy metal translocating P-type ATPase [Colletotrichum higginsianum]